MRRVGVLMNGSATDSVPQAYAAAFVQALRQLGWIEGQNLRIDLRWNPGGSALAQTPQQAVDMAAWVWVCHQKGARAWTKKVQGFANPNSYMFTFKTVTMG